MTLTLHLAQALLPEGFADDVTLTVATASIARVEAGVRAGRGGSVSPASTLPGMPNLHSHAFQRGMAGLAERRGAPEEFLLDLARGDVPLPRPARSRRRAGDRGAGLRRDAGRRLHRAGRVPLSAPRQGRPALCAISRPWPPPSPPPPTETGLGLTLAAGALSLRQFRRGAAGPWPAPLRQRSRWLCRGWSRPARAAIRHLPDARLGLAPHSLRAVALDDLTWLAGLAPGRPVPHPCRRADARGRGQPGDHRPAPGRVADATMSSSTGAGA